jgi:hypothetical protein
MFHTAGIPVWVLRLSMTNTTFSASGYCSVTMDFTSRAQSCFVPLWDAHRFPPKWSLQETVQLISEQILMEYIRMMGWMEREVGAHCRLRAPVQVQNLSRPPLPSHPKDTFPGFARNPLYRDPWETGFSNTTGTVSVNRRFLRRYGVGI